MLFRCLSGLFEAGIPLTRSLNVLSEESETPRLAACLSSVSALIQSGHTFSHALAGFPRWFGEPERRLIEVAESTGALPVVLRRLADYEERRWSLEGRLRSALALPMLVILLSVAMVVVLPPLVFRDLLELFASSSVTLPWPTRILLVASRLANHPLSWLVALALAALAGQGLRRALTPRRRARLVLALPYLGTLSRCRALASYCRSLALMLGCGVSAPQALRLACRASGNPLLQAEAETMVQGLMDGLSLADCHRQLDLFPEAAVQMIHVGEESGKLPLLLEKMTHLYEQEIEYRVDLLAAVLEPVLLAGVGGLVAFVALALLLPLSELVKTL